MPIENKLSKWHEGNYSKDDLAVIRTMRSFSVAPDYYSFITVLTSCHHPSASLSACAFLQIATMKTEGTTEAWSAKRGRASPARGGTLTHLTGPSMSVYSYVYTSLRASLTLLVAFILQLILHTMLRRLCV